MKDVIKRVINRLLQEVALPDLYVRTGLPDNATPEQIEYVRQLNLESLGAARRFYESEQSNASGRD